MLKYIAWNAFLIGTLAAGYFAGAPKFAGVIVGIIYGIILPILFAAMFVFQYALEHPEVTDLSALMKALEKWRWYKGLFDIVFIVCTFAMGYNKLGVCMIAELAMFLYLYATYKHSQHNKEGGKDV